MKAYFKKLDVRGHFPDFKHKAQSQRDNKKIAARKERRKLNVSMYIDEVQEIQSMCQSSDKQSGSA